LLGSGHFTAVAGRLVAVWVSSSVCGYLGSVDKFLGIYLRDQLALGVLWRQLARRAAHHNRGTPLGEALARVATGIAEDVDTFHTIMNRIGVRANSIKTGLAIIAERIGRLKLNGRLVGYSPLSCFLELEALTMGIDGKKQLWTSLRDLAGLAGRLPDVDFDHLIHRAERQHAELEPFRVEAGTRALSARRAAGS
jgi:hypothetical protein